MYVLFRRVQLKKHVQYIFYKIYIKLLLLSIYIVNIV